MLVCAAGTVPSDITKLFDAAGGGQLHLEFGNSCMGYDIPAAIGVRLADVGGEVYVLLGDGNYQMHPMELRDGDPGAHQADRPAERQLRLPVDPRPPARYVGHSLGNEFKIRDEATGRIDEGEYVEVDYVKNAESMGLTAIAAPHATRSVQALSRLAPRDTSTLIAVYIDKSHAPPGSGVWWEVIGAQVTGDETTRRLVEEREQGRTHQRFLY